ncbi:MAG: NADH-quinone oxidoreductase subunit L, partial [Planctomycetes bacterium]|nr:NADH-quinone oxidoreductase subunit L [Planctomycetota bacterium]
TPVSALIHAATMVTAGVYMIARMNFVYALSPAAMTVVAAVGAATALFAGTIGVAQNDIKKVLAYSTVSQLGFMFMGVGVGAFAAGIFHLMTHAFFKACLFLGSGSVIHGMGGEQDIRKMGGLKQHMPITFWTFTVASLAIAGFPLLAGFWSKDEILWKTWSTQALVLPGWMLWLLGITAAAFTAFYMTRLVVLTFLGEPRWSVAPAPDPADAGHGTHDAGHATHDAGHATHDSGHPAWHGPHESPWPMTAPLVVLMVLSIVGGFIGMPHWMPGGGVFEHWLDPVCPDMTQGRAAETALLSPTAAGAHPQEHEGQAHGPPVMEILLMLVSIGVGLGGIWAGLKVYYWGRGKRAEAFAERNRELYELVRDKYRVDELYQNVVIEPLLAVNETVGRFDNAIVDGAVNGAGDASVGLSKRTGIFDNDVVDGGVNATALAIQFAGRATRRIQTGRIRSYVQSAVVGGLVVIALYCVYLQRDALGVFMGWK